MSGVAKWRNESNGEIMASKASAKGEIMAANIARSKMKAAKWHQRQQWRISVMAKNGEMA